MMPFIHLGPVRLAMYGIMMVTGMFVGYYLFSAELRRRRIEAANPLLIAVVLALGGLLFSKLYLALESPARFLADPGFLINRAGYTFYGAVLGDLLLLALMAKFYKVSAVRLLDALACSCAIGYGIGRMGCFFAGDGDYGVPTGVPWGMSFPHGLLPTMQAVHPTPLYEFLTSAVLALWLWHLGSPRRRGRAVAPAPAPGTIFAMYLIGSGFARFLVEFIKLNPPVALGLVNAQWVALFSIAAGILLWRYGIFMVRHSAVWNSPVRDSPVRESPQPLQPQSNP
jgi:phosphatidylglycerol:prolipoprotein diacylglycerol transferase